MFYFIFIGVGLVERQRTKANRLGLPTRPAALPVR